MKVFPLISPPELSLLFQCKMSQTSCAEKAIKVLGVGFGGDGVTVTTVTRENGDAILQPSFKRVLPSIHHAYDDKF